MTRQPALHLGTHSLAGLRPRATEAAGTCLRGAGVYASAGRDGGNRGFAGRSGWEVSGIQSKPDTKTKRRADLRRRGALPGT
jgi:hypothetical protein